MAITSLDSKGISEFVLSQANSVVESVKERASREAEMRLNGLKFDYFELLIDRKDLQSALVKLFEDKRYAGFRPREDLEKLLFNLEHDVITVGTNVIKINRVSLDNPKRYKVLSEPGSDLVTVLLDKEGKPEGTLQYKGKYISEGLFDQLTQVFGDVTNHLNKKFTEAEFKAFEKALAQRKSIFMRVLGRATSLIFGKDRFDRKDRVDNHIRDFRFDFILETFKVNKRAVIPENSLSSEIKIVVVDPKNKRIIRHATLKNRSDNGWYAIEFLIAPRGMESRQVSFKITEDMMIYDPLVVLVIEEKAKQTLKSASMRFVNQLAWSIRHR